MRGGGLLSSLARAATKAAARGVRPSRLGVHGYMAVVKFRLASTLAAPIVGIALYMLLGPPGFLGGLPLLAAAAAAPSIYRYILASGLEREASALLAYLLPFSWTSKGLTDVLVTLQGWKGKPFRWVSREAERLAVKLRLGADPVSALEWIAETTPGKTLSAALRDYIHAVRLGVPKGLVTQRLLDRALEAVRSAWRSYVSLARAGAELAAALVVLVAALAPAAALASLNPAAISLILAAPAPLALILALSQPSLGMPQTHPAVRLAPLAVAGASGVLVVKGLSLGALALLAAAGAAVEAYAASLRRLQFRAWSSLSRAIEKARLGLMVDDDLREAEPAAPGIVSALLESSRIAGSRGLTRALQGIYGVIAEARSLAKTYSWQSMLMSLVSAAAVAVAVYAVKALSELASVHAAQGLIDPTVINAVTRILLATSPLAPLPAATAGRPWAPTLVPSLIALAASLKAAGSLGIPGLGLLG